MTALYGLWHGMIVHLWQTTLVLAIIFMIDRALRNAPSSARHALWSIGLLKLFLPLSVLGSISGALVQAAVGHSALRGGAAFTLPPVLAAVLDPLSSSNAAVRGSALWWALAAGTACWGTFALYFILRGAVDAARAGRPGEAPGSALDASEAGRLGAILDGAGIPRESVLVSRRLAMPAVVGILRPRIIMPDCLVSELSDEGLRAVLFHEEAHRRRRDPLRGAICRLSVALFFFYPPLYLILGRLRATAEFACDENVVRSGISADAYARALARTLELGLSSPAFAAAAAAGGSLLRQRLKRIATLNPRRYAMRIHYRVLIALAGLLVAGTAFLPATRAARPEQGAMPAATQQKSDTGAAANFDVPPKVITATNPKYPEPARKLGIETTVLLNVTINEKGKVTKVKAPQAPELGTKPGQELSAAQTDELHALFVKSSVEALKSWKFEAARLEGKPVTSTVAIPLRFKLH